MKRIQLLQTALFALALVFWSSVGWGQEVWQYDFNVTPAEITSGFSEEFFPDPPENGGTYRVRIGTAGGGLELTGEEAILTASASASTNKLGVYGWNSPTPNAYIKFKINTTSSGNGLISVALGNDGLVINNTSYNQHYNNSLGILWLNYSEGEITSVNRRGGGSNHTITNHEFIKGTEQVIEIYGNNRSVASNYQRGDVSYPLDSQSWDLWVGGVKVSPENGWPVAGNLAANDNLSGFAVFAESSTGNAATVTIDDYEYANFIPQEESDEPFLIGDPSTLEAMFYAESSGPSASHSFELTGENLDNSDVSVNAHIDFEVSSDNITFSDDLTLTAYDGIATDIYVRMKAELTVGDYNGEVAISGGGADAISVAVSGTVVETFGIPYLNAFRTLEDLDLALAQGFEIVDAVLSTAAGGRLDISPNGYLETPTIDFTNYNNILVSFEVATLGTGSNRVLSVKVSSDNGATFETLEEIDVTAPASNYDKFNVSINITGQHNTDEGKIRFQMTDGTGGIRFRDMEIKPITSPTITPNAFVFEDFINFEEDGATTSITWNDATAVEGVFITIQEDGELIDVPLPFTVTDIDGTTATLFIEHPEDDKKSYGQFMNKSETEVVLDGYVVFDVGEDADFTMTFTDPSWWVEISLTDQDDPNHYIGGAQITVSQMGEPDQTFFTGTDPNEDLGFVEFQLKEGTYTLTIEAEGYETIENYEITVVADLADEKLNRRELEMVKEASETITFYFRGPDWMNNVAHDPEVWGPFTSGDWTSATLTWDDVLGWWKAKVEVADPEAEITYQMRFSEDATTKFQKALDGSDPKFTTATGEIWIDASGEIIWDVGGQHDFALADNKISHTNPSVLVEQAKDALDFDLFVFEDGDDPENVTQNFKLPSTVAVNNATVGWSSSNTDVIIISEETDEFGYYTANVTRPEPAKSNDAAVILTAHIAYGNQSDTKDFEVIVKEDQLVASTYQFDFTVPSDIFPDTDVQVDVNFATDVEGDFGYDDVRFAFAATGPGDVTFTATDGSEIEHEFTNSGFWGPETGFNLPALYTATTEWTLNFSTSGSYTITFSLIEAPDGAVVADITDEVVIEVLALSDEANILAFSFAEQTAPAVIDADAATIAVEVAHETDLTGLVASFTLSDYAVATVGGTIQESGVTANDFSSPVTYVVTAQDGVTTRDWVVMVTEAGPDPDIIVLWDFEDEAKRTLASSDISLYQPDIGNGEISLIDANFTGYAQGAPNTGSAANSNAWEDGVNSKYWQISFSSRNYEGLKVSSKQRGSNTGPRDFKIQYSLDGLAWIDLGVDITVANNFTSGVVDQIELPEVCDQQSELHLRWVVTSTVAINGSPVAAGGTNRIDDIRITGFHNDITPPVATFSPAHGAENVAIDVTPTITFDEPVFISEGVAVTNDNVEALISFTDAADADVAFSATIDGQVITVVPGADLENDVAYTLTIAALQDEAGNVMDAPATASFTTIAADAPVLTLTSTHELYYAGDVIEVTWEAENITLVTLELYDPISETWSVIEEDVDASLEAATYTIPEAQAYAANYILRISTSEVAELTDESGDFKIRAVAQDLATVRGYANNAEFRYDGEAVVTYARTFRNHKYIQDATAAVLIDDDNAIITDTYVEGDVFTGLIARKNVHNNIVQIVPLENPGEPTTTAELVPVVVNLEDITTEYQSMLVAIPLAEFETTGTFTTGTNYTLTDATEENITFRTSFNEVDYIGEDIPQGVMTRLIALVGEFGGNPQLTSRRMDDFVMPSSDASLAVFTLSGENILDLQLEVDDPATDDGATLVVMDFTDFEGIAIQASDDYATVNITLNGDVVEPADYETQVIADGDVIVATVTAEDGTVVFYKITIRQFIHAAINPEVAEFDLSNTSDVSTTITYNDAGDLVSVVHDTETLTVDVDYTLTGNTLTILKAYLEGLNLADLDQELLTLNFQQGDAVTFTINVTESGVVNAVIDPVAADFDLYAPADLTTTVTLNDASEITGITENGTALQAAEFDFESTTGLLTILAAYFDEAVAAEVYTFTISFDAGDDATFTVTIIDSSPDTYAVTFSVVEVDDQANGTLTAEVDGTAINTGDEVEEGKDVVFTAAPAAGFRVKEWKLNGDVIMDGTDVVTALAYTYTDIQAPVNVTVEFEAIPFVSHEVTFSVTGANGTLTAAVDGDAITTGADVQEGSDVVFTAAPDAGYKVKEWTLDGDVIMDETDVVTALAYTYSDLDKDIEVTVEFEAIVPATLAPVAATFDLMDPTPADIVTVVTFVEATAITAIEVDGTELTADTYEIDGGELTIMAAYFAGMDAGDVEFSIVFDYGLPLTFTVTLISPELLEATLQVVDFDDFTGLEIQTNAENAELSAWLNGEPIEVNATGNHIHIEDQEFENGDVVLVRVVAPGGATRYYQLTLEQAPTITFIVKDESDDLMENVEILIDGETLTTDANGVAEIILIDGTYEYTVQAVGYISVVDNVIVEGDDKTVEVTLEEVPVYTLTLAADPEVGGTVDGAGDYEEGTEVTITATPEDAYQFVNWTDEADEVVSTDAVHIYTMPDADVTLTANFALIPTYTLTLAVAPADAGTVTGDGDYSEGTEVDITATAAAGYAFRNWTDDDGVEISSVANFTFTMPAADVTLTANFDPLVITDVATLAELRAKPADGELYRYTGNAVIVAMDGYRNRKFIQDESAAIMIDDQPGTISTSYDLYDVITNVVGRIAIHNDMVQFQPTENTAAATENTPVDPIRFNLDEPTSDDQAKLVKFFNVSFTEVEAGAVFTNGRNYKFTDGTNEFVLRTDFWGVDYIGETVPDEAVNIAGVILEYQGTLQIVPRFLADIEIATSVSDIFTASINVFPNPARDNFTITANSIISSIMVIDITGKVVYTDSVKDTEVRVYNQFEPGIYIVRIYTENGVVMRKLQIQR